VTRFFFDAASRLRYTQSPKGLWAEYRYDELNRLVEYEDEDANVTKYEYDENDNVVGVVSPLAMIWTGPFPPWLWGYGGGAGGIWQSRYRRTGGGGLAGSRRAGPVDGKERRNKRT
jgi:YD repeat-containing protein